MTIVIITAIHITPELSVSPASLLCVGSVATGAEGWVCTGFWVSVGLGSVGAGWVGAVVSGSDGSVGSVTGGCVGGT